MPNKQSRRAGGGREPTKRPLDRNPVHLVEREVVVCGVVQLRRPRRLVRRDRLSVLNRAAILQVYRDVSGTECVAQHVEVRSPAASARRLIISSTSERAIGFGVSWQSLSTLRKSGLFVSSPMPARLQLVIESILRPTQCIDPDTGQRDSLIGQLTSSPDCGIPGQEHLLQVQVRYSRRFPIESMV